MPLCCLKAEDCMYISRSPFLSRASSAGARPGDKCPLPRGLPASQELQGPRGRSSRNSGLNRRKTLSQTTVSGSSPGSGTGSCLFCCCEPFRLGKHEGL